MTAAEVHFGEIGRMAEGTGEAQPADDPRAFRDILAKHEDHLIRDIGKTREELLGPEKAFWSEWLKAKVPWQL